MEKESNNYGNRNLPIQTSRAAEHVQMPSQGVQLHVEQLQLQYREVRPVHILDGSCPAQFNTTILLSAAMQAGRSNQSGVAQSRLGWYIPISTQVPYKS